MRKQSNNNNFFSSQISSKAQKPIVELPPVGQQVNDGGIQRTLTPEQFGAIKSQWKRYDKATEIVSDAFIKAGRPGDGASGSDDFTLKYFRPESLPLLESSEGEPDYFVTVRQVGDASISLFEQVFAEVTPDGAIVQNLGTYQVTDVLESVTQDYLVIGDDGNTVALISSGTNVIRALGDPTLVTDALRKGTAIGYACTCSSFTNKGSTIAPTYTGEFDSEKTWAVSGTFGACKHILAARYNNGDAIKPPIDIPMIDEVPLEKISSNGKMPKRPKGMR